MARLVAIIAVVLSLVSASQALADEGRTLLPFLPPGGGPIPITIPGRYLLTANIINAAIPGPTPIIAVALPSPPTNGQVVDIDLGGFVLNNTASPGFPVITVTGGPLSEIHIRNGSLAGGLEGISVLVPIRKVVIEDVQVGNTVGAGIHLTNPANFAIRRAAVFAAGGPGIQIDSGIAPVLKQGVIEDSLINGTVSGIAVFNANGLILRGNQVRSITPGLFPGAIFLSVVEPCLVSENTIEGVTGTNGISAVDAEGCKFVENVISDTGMDGIVLDAASSDNLLLHNIVRGAFGDGIHIFGVRNSIEGNIMGNNGRVTGVGYGLHFGVGSARNRFGRNGAADNPGGACAVLVNSDYCDETGPLGANNFSFGDNMMPGPAKF